MLEDHYSWKPLIGINGKKVYCKLSDVVFFEEHDVGGNDCATVHLRFGTRFTVEHSAEELVAILNDAKDDASKRTQKEWKERLVIVTGKHNIR